MRTLGLVLTSSALLAAGGLGAAWLIGTLVSAPAPAVVGAPPPDIPVEPVTIASPSGRALACWLVRGEPRRGAVLLLHGVRANRLQMLGRIRLLHRHGFSVLACDFQAHGESAGRHITFGYLESRDARAAFDHLRRAFPDERAGVIGVSLGGAAAALADPPLEANALVLEAVFASFRQAVENRLAILLGERGRVLAPLLLWQVRPRLGVDPHLLQPAARMGAVHAPVLLIAGDADARATLAETHELYTCAHAPKELWIIPGAGHVDFERYAPEDYARRVVAFLTPHLGTP
jgi:pimeloyl-ACP methyl ester carboxylesterase